MSATTFLGLSSLSDRNISLYFLPAVSPPLHAAFPSELHHLTSSCRAPQVYMLAFSPHEIKLLTLGTRYNNNKPRDPVDFRKGDTEDYKQKVEKLGGIHHNGMESFPLFAVALVCPPLFSHTSPTLY
jgi:hypothetical protein